MKLWLSALLVLAVVSALEARRGGRRREWRRQKMAELQASRQGLPAVGSEDDIKDDDEDTQKNDWNYKKQRKWAMKRQRKMKWMNKRRGMMSPVDENTDENANGAEVNSQDSYPTMFRRRWEQRKANKVERRQKLRKMKRWHKKHGKGPSCICHLETEQLEKLQELIKKEGLEDQFPQIMPPEGDSVDDVTEETDDADDIDDSDDVVDDLDEDDEVTESGDDELPLMTTESSFIIQ
eukprot:CAMPEP_0203744178 /NCGR_PEP_ID=MMETSP0098-20131031/344_1 /ASSEMBLY_ACC=CAM_ASM_000208 /TAXON_ID=96639 /ORGANISM=" , Strain NY0313808BC1" /LENGTH=235 /DNA_ID=CAMNT_0050631633 /DNA_START=1 /DNA_END=708 /DNA_ORIENTATION=+